MKNNKSIITIDEIHNVFKENCKEENREFTREKFEKFLEYCERDFCQWLKDNIKCFFISR